MRNRRISCALGFDVAAAFGSRREIDIGSRNRSATRCIKCRLLADLCVCAELPRIATETRIVLVTHYREDLKTTNSGRLATLMLPNAEIRIRGTIDQDDDLSNIPAADRRTYVLYPDARAESLTPAFAHLDPRPLTLIVPDASWRQARKVITREPDIARLPRLTFAPSAPTEFRVRKSRRSAAHLSTLEAIAQALGIIEGHGVEAALRDGFLRFVHRTMYSRGQHRRADIHGGLPSAVQPSSV